MDDKIYKLIVFTCNEGEKLFDKEFYSEAINFFHKAFELIPESKRNWEAGNWIQVAIGDCFFNLGKFEKANEYFRHSEIYPNSKNSGFPQLRIGQCYYEINDLENAKEYLMRAFLLGGIEIFDEEDEKYIFLISELIKKDTRGN